MSDYLPFIDDPSHLRVLEGQRYVVIRPDANVSSIHVRARSRLEDAFPGLPISYPRRGHVTLAGFPKATSLELIQDLVREWGTQVPALTIEVEGHDHFPSPAKIAIVRIKRTEDLFEALATLRARALAKKLGPFTFVPVEEWIFHMSVAYCSNLDDATWEEVVALHESVKVPSQHCVASEVEVVGFDYGVEHLGGSYAFRR